jgi:serine/threonine protein kinase
MLDPTKYSKIVFGIVAGMAHLHSLGFLHHDLKPHNILLNESLEPIIAGLELALPYSSSDQRTCGTALFLAPELFESDELIHGFPLDVYSFAVTLYFLFAIIDESSLGRIHVQTFTNL